MVSTSFQRKSFDICFIEYNELKNSLQDYLRKFAENKKTVREEDIKEFFSQMTSRKRQKVDIPFNCK